MSDQDIERRRSVGLLDSLAAYDCVERGRATQDVVGFDGENFTERVCGTVAQEPPDLHFADALTAVLRFAAERLLRRERIRTDASHVDFVFHHVVELQHVHDAYGNRLSERLASAAVEEHSLAARIHSRLLKFITNLLLGGA